MRVANKEADDRRKALREAAAKVRTSLDKPFRQMGSDAIMKFLRPTA